MNTQPSDHYREDIDGLRGLAILLVLGYHYFPTLLSGGFIGVDVFFVISGYVITSLLLREVKQTQQLDLFIFFCKRVNRIFPALILVLTFAYLFGLSCLTPSQFYAICQQIIAGALFVSNIYFMGDSNYFAASSESKPLLHLWSLAIEEQFYLIWPLLLFLTIKSRKCTLFLLGILVIISYIFNIKYLHDNNLAKDFYSIESRFWELGLGSLMAFFSNTNADRKIKYGATQRETIIHSNWLSRSFINMQANIGFLLIITSALFLNNSDFYPGTLVLFPTLGTVMLIGAGKHTIINNHLFSHRYSVMLGKISYSLYLWHWLLYSLCLLFLTKKPSGLTLAGLISLSFALAYMTCRFVENPYRRQLNIKLKAAVMVCLMFIIATLSYISPFYVFKADSLDNAELSAQINFKHDYKDYYREGSCFLRLEQEVLDFKFCANIEGSTKNYRLVLWGDSHAAHLYTGYLNRFGNEADILQLTVSSCPPLIGIGEQRNRNCLNLNNEIIRFVTSNRPNKVVLSAAWASYDWIRIEETIKVLLASGIRSIDLVGPSPQWVGGLNKNINLQYDRIGDIHSRIEVGLDLSLKEVDQKLRDLAKQYMINYISPIELLCGENGCDYKVDSSPDGLISWDGSHFTKKGSQHLLSLFPHLR
jgi:peptidoglycan/LPS O-acetylase OafA/YrhL